MSELQTLKCYMSQMPATILSLLGITPPANVIPEPVQSVLDLYEGIERISINMIDKTTRTITLISTLFFIKINWDLSLKAYLYYAIIYIRKHQLII